MSKTTLPSEFFVFNLPKVLHSLNVMLPHLPLTEIRIKTLYEGKVMATLRATASEIKKAIIDYVSIVGNVTPSEIFVPMNTAFPENNHYEIRWIVKEMQKDNTLVPDIIYGGLRVSTNY